MLKETQFTAKSCIHHSEKKGLCLFNKRSVIVCPPATKKVNRLLENSDTFLIIAKNLSFISCLRMRSVCHQSKKLISSILPNYFSLEVFCYNTLMELSQTELEKLQFRHAINNGKIKIQNLSFENDTSNLINFLNNPQNNFLLTCIEHIEGSDDVVDDNVDDVQKLLKILPSLSTFSFKGLWGPILSLPLSLKHLSSTFINGPLDLKQSHNLISLNLTTIMAPIEFPENLSNLISLTYEKVVEQPEVLQKIKDIQKAIKNKNQPETTTEDYVDSEP